MWQLEVSICQTLKVLFNFHHQDQPEIMSKELVEQPEKDILGSPFYSSYHQKVNFYLKLDDLIRDNPKYNTSLLLVLVGFLSAVAAVGAGQWDQVQSLDILKKCFTGKKNDQMVREEAAAYQNQIEGFIAENDG